MRVLAIEGSPHKGNTHDRVDAFGEALKALGNVEFEHVALRDVDLRPCAGCFACFVKGEEACPLDDDVRALVSKMEEADAVVFATPVYSMHISYLMKLFVDRLAYTFHRPRYFGTYAVGMAVSGGVGLKETVDYLKMFAGTWGFEYVGDLLYADPPRGTRFPRFAKPKDSTADVAARLYERVVTKPARRLSKDDHLMFHAMRAVYSRLEDRSPVDYRHWKERGWLEPEARYFTEHARVGWLKSIYPRFVAWAMSRALDRSDRKSASENEDSDALR